MDNTQQKKSRFVEQPENVREYIKFHPRSERRSADVEQYDASFDESKHAREATGEKGGQFTAGSGGSGGASEQSPQQPQTPQPASSTYAGRMMQHILSGKDSDDPYMSTISHGLFGNSDFMVRAGTSYISLDEHGIPAQIQMQGDDSISTDQWREIFEEDYGSDPSTLEGKMKSEYDAIYHGIYSNEPTSEEDLHRSINEYFRDEVEGPNVTRLTSVIAQQRPDIARDAGSSNYIISGQDGKPSFIVSSDDRSLSIDDYKEQVKDATDTYDMRMEEDDPISMDEALDGNELEWPGLSEVYAELNPKRR